MHPLFHSLFINYCAYFNGNQDYFECHEVLEEYWKTCAPGEKSHPLVGYVQLATGMYHWRRNNVKGALKILKKAQNNFSTNQGSAFFDFIDYKQLCADCHECITAIEEGESFVPFSLLVTSDELTSLVNKEINKLPPTPKDYLLHKHMLRDRSDILKMRNEKIGKRDRR